MSAGTVRKARPEDAQAIAGIEIETWRTTYAGMLPDRVLLGMSEHRHLSSWTSFLRHRADDVRVAPAPDGSLVGFGNCGPQRNNAVPFGGEVYTLYVSPDFQGLGIGRQLLLALFRRLVESGHESAVIWVVRSNPARFFYERLGGKQVMHRPITVGGQSVEAIAYGWRDLRAMIDRHARSGDGFADNSMR